MHIILITGAALVGLPILLHLIMRQDPKKLPFPAFRFLKIKRRINQRKMRLRHFLLLAMRMLLIALIAASLFQPDERDLPGCLRSVSSRVNLKGDAPINCVIVIDTSPSMGYVLTVDRAGLSEARKRGPALLEEHNPEDNKLPWTSLDEARFRALELIDELPPNSNVAVVDTTDREAHWSLTLVEARKKIRQMKRTKAASRSVTQTLPLAYDLFRRVGKEGAPSSSNRPRLLCVFSDRTEPSWDTAQEPYLLLKKKDVAGPEIVSAFIDVGVDKPLNLAIVGVEMKPQLVPADKPIEFTVILQATGAVPENVLEASFNDDLKPLTLPVRIEPGGTKEFTFRRDGLTPGLYQVKITLQTPDALPTDDVRYLTFRVREPRKVLAVADALPTLGAVAGSLAQVDRINRTTRLWRVSLEATAWYSCDVATTKAYVDMKPADLARYEAVILDGLIDPSAEVWDKSTAYVTGGGKLIVVPGADDRSSANRDQPPPGYDNKLLPGTFKKWIEPGRDKGVEWAWEALKAHPLLVEFKEWLKNPRIEFIALRPQTWGYWEVEPHDKLNVIVSYADSSDADKRRPAILESHVGKSGQVLLFTVPMDGQSLPPNNLHPGYWNDYAKTSFFLVLTNLTIRYLTGDSEDMVFNFTSGQSVPLKFPPDAPARSKLYRLNGPDVGDKESEIIREENETERRLESDRLKAAGNFQVISDPTDKKPDLKPWRDGFSLNAPAEESNLDRRAVADIETILGKDCVTASDKNRKIYDILGGRFRADIEFFPFLLILLLLFLAFENLLSNKFYRQAKTPVA